MSSVAPALAPTNIISIILNSSLSQAVRPPKQMHRTCASCRQRQAQPFRVLGRNVPAQPSGSAQRPSPGTASPSLLGSGPWPPGGTAASGPRPGLFLGCGPSRPASRHSVRVIRTASFCSFSPAVSVWVCVCRSIPVPVPTSVTAASLRYGRTGCGRYGHHHW